MSDRAQRNSALRATPQQLKELRTLNVAVIHPDDADGRQLTQQLQRIGCRVQAFWPPVEAISKCRIPDDCIDSKRYPLFIARTVLRELIESLEPTGSVKP